MGDFTESIQQLSTSTEFKRALKVLIKYEINCLLKRLSDTGEEAIIITTSLEDGVQGHLGTVKGEGFLQATDSVKTLKEQFLHFCKDSSGPEDTNKNRTIPVDFSKILENSHQGLDVGYEASPEAKSHTDSGIWDGGRHVCEERDDKRAPNESKEKDTHCLMNDDKLYPLEPRNTESVYFQESEQGITCRREQGIVCKTFQESEQGIDCKRDKVRKMIEETETSSKEMVMEFSEEDRDSLPNKNEIATSYPEDGQISVDLQMDKQNVSFDVNGEDDRCSSPIERCRNRDQDRSWKKLSRYGKGPLHGTNQFCKHPKKDQRISDPLTYTDHHTEEHMAGFNDLLSHKMLAFYPGFNMNIDQNLMSRHDFDYLQRCYFGGGYRNDGESEPVLDFSIKKEKHTEPGYFEDSINSFHQEDKSRSPNLDMVKLPDHKNSSGQFDLFPDTGKHSPSKRHRPNKASVETVVSKFHGEENLNKLEKESCGETSRIDNYTGLYDDKTDKPDLCEPINLKMEPEDRYPTPVVKLEPGTECTSTIEKILSDPNVPNFIAQSHSQGLSPPCTSSPMHLNFCCKVCGQNFKNRQYRDFHVKLHETSHQYFCNLCNAGFNDETDCKKHQGKHTEPVFQCESCGYRCTREFRMRAHKEICGSPSKVFKCPFCHKQFAAQRYMRIHIKSHDAHNIHTCPVCQNTYPLKNSLLKHMKKKHSQM